MTHAVSPSRSLPRRARAAAVLALAALPALGGCYRAVPVGDPAAIPVGRRVVVSLTSAGTSTLTGQLGPNVVRAEGVLTATRGDTLELSLLRTVQASGSDDTWQRQPLALSRSLVAGVSERRLDRVRSWLVAGGIVALAVIAAAAAAGGSGGDAPGSVVTPPN